MLETLLRYSLLIRLSKVYRTLGVLQFLLEQLLQDTSLPHSPYITNWPPSPAPEQTRCGINSARRTPLACNFRTGAWGENRTLMRLPSMDFESIASANSATQAHCYSNETMPFCKPCSDRIQDLSIELVFVWFRLQANRTFRIFRRLVCPTRQSRNRENGCSHRRPFFS